jgi:hypothetical protein
VGTRGAGSSLWPRSSALKVKAREVLRRKAPADLSEQRTQILRTGEEVGGGAAGSW